MNVLAQSSPTILFGGSVTCLDAFRTEAMSLGYTQLL